LGAPTWLWTIAAGIAVGLFVYAAMVRDEALDEKDTVRPPSPASNGGSGSGSAYHNSTVVNVTVDSDTRTPDPSPGSEG
jgi:hypothetical protein